VYVWDPFKYPKMGVSIVDAFSNSTELNHHGLTYLTHC
jgi:hypothetical protein